MHHDPKLLLVSLRDPHDPMAEHERSCVGAVCRVDPAEIVVHTALTDPLHASDLHGVDAVFFGGSGAYSILDPHPWRQDAIDALKRVIDERIPSWASCFGFQGLALALHADVVHDPSRAEMGGVQLQLTDLGAADPLVGMLPRDFWVQSGHQDHVDRLPEGCLQLATGGVGCEQLTKVDGAPFYASQFHPELDVEAIVYRFEFYADHYSHGDPEGFARKLAALQSSPDTPEMVKVLQTLVRQGRS